MSELVKLETKNPDIKQKNSNIPMRKSNHPHSINTSTDRILFLQRTIGNQAVSRLIESGTLQAKLKIGQPGDIYEQEADRMAERVMHMPEPQVQRQAEVEEEEELVQPKLTANAEYSIQRQVDEEEEKEEDLIQTKPLVDQITPLIQRQVEEEEEEEPLQTKRDVNTTPEATENLTSQIQAIQYGGQPLSKSERAYFEPRFGADFSQVRLHSDAQASESARALNAKAYTLGQDVVFGTGQDTPGTSEGRRLMAHELTHVVQQSGKK
ncbi:protein of unknown function (DUF4157) [Candidatus Methanomarinus sp.]|nr:protein of unknown function (DUF4157) [ANME-2 cluster archaeon]